MGEKDRHGAREKYGTISRSLQVRRLDERMNDAGFLRLMTPEPLMMNMSNSVEPVTAQGDSRPEPRRSRRRRIADWAPVRRILLKVYDSIFRLYFDRGASP